MSKHSVADVLIIGAGAAGLSCAHLLAKAGIRITIIEARDRVGGRIQSLRNESCPVPIELGAEFVHGRAPELFELAEAAGLTLIDVSGRHWFLQDGRIIKSAAAWSSIEQVMEKVKHANRDLGFAQFLRSRSDIPEDAKARVIRYVQDFHAADLERIGTDGLNAVNDAAESVDGNKTFRLLGGYDQLTNWLYREVVRLDGACVVNTIARTIDWSAGLVSVNTANGSDPITAKQCVITVPVGVLQSGAIEFRPALPRGTQTAIARLQMGNVIKINLQFSERFWETISLASDKEPQSLWDFGFIHSFKAPFPTWWTRVPERTPLLVGWVGGPDAENLLAEGIESTTSAALRALANLLQVTETYLQERLVASYLHDWKSDPFTKGAYSYLAVGGREAQNVASTPIHDKLFFAGEALSDGHVGTVHGAIISGVRVANQIIQSHRK